MSRIKPLFKVYCATEELAEQFQRVAFNHNIRWLCQSHNQPAEPWSTFRLYLIVTRGYDGRLWISWMSPDHFFKTETDMLYVTAEEFIRDADVMMELFNK